MNDQSANAEQVEAWNGESGTRWVATADGRDQVLGPVGDALLEHAAIRTGERVLDVGCGCGATSLAAATGVGPTGAVTGIDLSAPMLELARDRAGEAGLGNVQLVQADAQTHQLGEDFDVAISRFGTMFFADPVAAFTNVAHHLRPGGRLCMVTWQPLVANEWLLVPGAALLPYGSLPDGGDPGAPGMFAQADPARITELLTGAEFRSIASTGHTLTLTFGRTIDDAVEYLADSGPGRAVLETVPAERRPDALDAVRRALQDHHAHDAVTLDAAVWITTATTPEAR